MVSVLEKLGFVMRGDEVVVPSWRSDIEHYADLAEEVARFYGYDVIEPTMFRGETAQGGWSPKQAFENQAAELCRAMGFTEILTYSFGSPAAWDRIRLPEDSPLRNALVIQNPLGEDRSVMRTTPLPSMLDVLALNAARRNPVVRFYETATVYLPQADSRLADEPAFLTLGEYGGDADFFQLKGSLEALLKDLRIENVRYEAVKDDPSFHPGRCARIAVNGRAVGILGQIHPLVCRNYELEGEVFYAQLDLPALRAVQSPEKTFVPLPKYPAIARDIALVCRADIPVAALEDTIAAAGGPYLEAVELFDVYTGAPIPAGQKSVAFSLTLRAADQTLTEDHAAETVGAILDALKKEYGAVIR